MKKPKQKSNPNAYIKIRNGRLECEICGKFFSHLGSHIWHKHKITAREYKAEFGLPYNLGLISDKIREKKQETQNWQQTWKQNFKESKKYRFKKGQTGQKRTTWRQIERLKKRAGQLNKRKLEQCPVCKMRFYKMASHLYNKHGLIKVGKI